MRAWCEPINPHGCPSTRWCLANLDLRQSFLCAGMQEAHWGCGACSGHGIPSVCCRFGEIETLGGQEDAGKHNARICCWQHLHSGIVCSRFVTMCGAEPESVSRTNPLQQKARMRDATSSTVPSVCPDSAVTLHCLLACVCKNQIQSQAEQLRTQRQRTLSCCQFKKTHRDDDVPNKAQHMNLEGQGANTWKHTLANQNTPN